MIRLPNDPEISGAILKDIAQAVINQAIKDIKQKSYTRQLDALYFLAGDDLPLWLAAAIGGDPDNLKCAGVEMLAAGRLTKDLLELQREAEFERN